MRVGFLSRALPPADAQFVDSPTIPMAELERLLRSKAVAVLLPGLGKAHIADWQRQHVSDLADVCKKLSSDSSLPIEHQQKFADVYTFIKRFSWLPAGGEGQSVAAAIASACDACQIAFDNGCEGRCDWRTQCNLVHKTAS